MILDRPKCPCKNLLELKMIRSHLLFLYELSTEKHKLTNLLSSFSLAHKGWEFDG